MTDESGWEVTRQSVMVGKKSYTGTVRAVSPEAKSFIVHVGLDAEGDFDGTPEGFERVVLEPGTTKNSEGRTLPYDLLPELADVIEEQWREHRRL